jgi:hypothetical protein
MQNRAVEKKMLASGASHMDSKKTAAVKTREHIPSGMPDLVRECVTCASGGIKGGIPARNPDRVIAHIT